MCTRHNELTQEEVWAQLKKPKTQVAWKKLLISPREVKPIKCKGYQPNWKQTKTKQREYLLTNLKPKGKNAQGRETKLLGGELSNLCADNISHRGASFINVAYAQKRAYATF